MSSDVNVVLRMVRRIRENSDRMQGTPRSLVPRRVYELLANSSPYGQWADPEEAKKACARLCGLEIHWKRHPDDSEEDSWIGTVDGDTPDNSVTGYDPFELLANTLYYTVEQWEDEWEGEPLLPAG